MTKYISKETAIKKLSVIKSLPKTFDRVRRIKLIESFLEFGKKLTIYNYEFIQIRLNRQKKLFVGCKIHSSKL